MSSGLKPSVLPVTSMGPPVRLYNEAMQGVVEFLISHPGFLVGPSLIGSGAVTSHGAVQRARAWLESNVPRAAEGSEPEDLPWPIQALGIFVPFLPSRTPDLALRRYALACRIRGVTPEYVTRHRIGLAIAAAGIAVFGAWFFANG